MNDIYKANKETFLRESLYTTNVIDMLFEIFKGYLRDQGLEARDGQNIDATLVPIPKQRNSRQEYKVIKANRLQNG